MKYRPECLANVGDIETLIGRWLTWLPIWEDKEETDHVYGYLCDLVEANNQTLLGGASNVNLPSIVSAIARVLSEKALSRPDEEEEAEKAVTMQNGAKTISVYDRCVAILRLIRVCS